MRSLDILIPEWSYADLQKEYLNSYFLIMLIFEVVIEMRLFKKTIA